MADKDFRGFPGPAFWIATSMAPAMYAGQMTLRMMQAMQRMGGPARMMMTGSFGPTGWTPDVKGAPETHAARKQAAPKQAGAKRAEAVEAEVIPRSRDVVPTPTEVMADVAQVTEPLMRAARETLETMNETLKGMTASPPTGRAEIAEPAPLAEAMEPETMKREASFRAPGESKAVEAKAGESKAAAKAEATTTPTKPESESEAPKAEAEAPKARATGTETPGVETAKVEDAKVPPAKTPEAKVESAGTENVEVGPAVKSEEAAKSEEPSTKAAETGKVVETGKSAETGARASEPKSSGAASADADRPTALTAPKGAADDLKKIKGVGPKLEGTLNELGYFHYDQIAAWGPDELRSVDESLGGFAGRATRDDWIAQAKLLAAGGEAGAPKRSGQGGLH